MKENFDPIDKALDIDSKIVDVEPKPITKPEVPEDPQKDYSYTRANLYNLISKGQEAIDGILEIAQESGHPRAFEVAGQLIKNVGDVSDKLLDLQKKMKDLDAPSKKGPTTVNNALFVGSTADLAKMLKDGLKEDNK